MTTYAQQLNSELGILSYWRANDAVGASVLTDQRGLNQIPIGTGVTLVHSGLLEGDTATCIQLGASNNLSLTTEAQLDFLNASPFSFEAWVLPTTIDANNRHILAKIGSTGGTQGYEFYVNSTGLTVARWLNGASDAVTTPTALSAGIPHLVAASYDGTTLRVGVDGVFTASVASSKALVSNTGRFRLGDTSVGSVNPFLGLLQEVAIYSSALSKAQFINHFNIGRRIFPDPQRIRQFDRMTITRF